eukprot:1189704-Prorocentrum_minimum.AAC.2
MNRDVAERMAKMNALMAARKEATAAPGAEQHFVLVLYGSETGNAERVAAQTAAQFEAAGHEVGRMIVRNLDSRHICSSGQIK